MKNYLIFFLNFINKIPLLLNSAKFSLKSNTFLSFSINASPSSILNFSNVFFKKSWMIIKGTSNQVTINNAIVSNSNITIDGTNNSIVFKDGVKFRNSTVIIRGTDCSLTIGQHTTFGGIRIVNTGTANNISIGEGCLFADHIELWASDTHDIINEFDDVINAEKPVKVGNKVWVGSRVIILKGTTIADGAVVGMGSLIVNDVPENSITVGAPNRIIKDGITWRL